jgi:hypothetical protein
MAPNADTPIDPADLLEEQPRTAGHPDVAGLHAVLRDRYSVIVGHRLPVMRFLEQNQAAVHQLMTEGQRDRHQVFRTQFERLRDLLAGPDAPAAGPGPGVGGRSLGGDLLPAVRQGRRRPGRTA